MRLELLYSPGLLCERLADFALQRRRLDKLRHTVAGKLSKGHIDSLELLEAVRPLGINVAYDIGANVGTWALLAKVILPEASVEAFEPLPKHHKEFHRNLTGVAGVRLHSLALGSKNESALLHVTDLSDASSLFPLADAGRIQFGIQEIQQISTEVRRLDDYRNESQLPLPDLLKLDVQGYELEVLKGGQDCLRSAKAIMMEVSFIEFYHGQCLFHELVEFLATRHFFLAVLGLQTRRGTPLQQADVLFLRHA